MPYQEQTEKNAAYIDIRFYLNKTTEVYTDDEGKTEEEWSGYEVNKVERRKLKNITEDEAADLGESFAQMDSYQLFFVNQVPYVVSDGTTAKFRS
ncbi:Hypothetical Protein OBI_RACECAR_58 [Arthrobacter phage Racecar]|nr:hypothetical protein PBI_RACECAR_140 [Arthrobacter phage Racecar]QFG12814.1 hypothetical protein PBI_MIMI_137 [Arthrobacter phage Mimi]